MEYFVIIIASIFVNNVVLSQFLGICPFLGVSSRVSTSVGMGAAVTFVMAISSVVAYLIQYYVLVPLHIEYMQTIIFILVIAALLTAALAIYSGISNQSLPSVIVQGVLAPFRAAGTTLTNTAEKYYSYMFRYEALDAENKVLEERIAQMEDVARQADSVSRENERLRRLLELKATNEDYKLVDAYIIGWSSSDWESTFTINRGTNAGIRENLCAITANGEVVGLVTEVGVNYAVVKTVLDSTLEISGTISTSGYNGMVKGGYVSGNDTLLQMNYLPSESIIRNKDQVVTSGSTVYPRGLIIGSVVDAGYEETGVAKFALLDPAADINSLEQVFIITQYTTEVAITPVTATDSETATAPSETAPSETAATQATTPVG